MASRETAKPAAEAKIETGSFYSEWHGHLKKHLQALVSSPAFSDPSVRRVWLAGDSSLDNKYWLFNGENGDFLGQLTAANSHIGSPAVNGYQTVLHPPVMAHDVAYWCNSIAEETIGPGKVVTINTSVEATTIADRSDGLLSQDSFIRENVRAGDYVIASLGGNDIALAPSTCTAVSCHVANVALFSTASQIFNCRSALRQ